MPIVSEGDVPERSPGQPQGSRDVAPRSVATLARLAAEPARSVGTRVLVDEDGTIYTSVGQTAAAIQARLGWDAANVWIPQHALAAMRRKHNVITDPVAAAQLVLRQPISVHEDREDPTEQLFFADAALLRDAGLLYSRRVRYVDAIVEERAVANGVVLRLFHLSPRDKNYGGRQRWP